MTTTQAVRKMSGTAMALQLADFMIEKFIIDFKPRHTDKQKLGYARGGIQKALEIYGASTGINIDDARKLNEAWFTSGSVGYWLFTNLAMLPGGMIDPALQSLKAVFDELFRELEKSEKEYCVKHGENAIDLPGTLVEYGFVKRGDVFVLLDGKSKNPTHEIIIESKKIKIKKGRGIVYFGRMPVSERELMEIMNWVL